MIPKTPVVREALALMKDWEKEPEHVLHVTDWAVRLFEELRAEHKLGKKELDYLAAGSLLHDTGWSTATEERPHHKESARRIREPAAKALRRPTSGLSARRTSLRKFQVGSLFLKWIPFKKSA